METFQPSQNEDGKTAAIISYFTIIGWLIAYFVFHKDKKTEFGSYQLRQTLLFAIVSFVLAWILGFIVGGIVLATGLGFLIYIVYVFQIGLLIMWLIGLIGAINGQKKPIPLIGEKAQSMFASI